MKEEILALTGISEEVYNIYGIQTLLQRPKSVVGLTKTKRTKLTALSSFIRSYNSATFLNEKVTLNSSSLAGDYVSRLYENVTDKEYFKLLLLDSQNHLINSVTIFEGTLTETAVYPREIVKQVLDHNASSVILAHNHPGGSLNPSSADIQATKNIRSALETIQVKVVDHIIATPYREYTSMAEKGLL